MLLEGNGGGEGGGEGAKRKPDGRHGDKKEIIILLFLHLKSLSCKRRTGQRLPFISDQLEFLIFSRLYFWSCQHTRRRAPGERRRGTPSLPSACRFWRRLARLQTWFYRLGMCWRSERVGVRYIIRDQHQTGRPPFTPATQCNHNRTSGWIIISS